MTHRTTTLAAAGLAAATLAACGSSSSGAGASSSAASDTSSSSSSVKQQTITVLAASSLTEAFDAIKKTVEAAHPGLTLKISYAASSTIVTQVNNGAPADILALADEKSESTLSKSLVSGKPVHLFATNGLEIAVPNNNPGKVKDLASLSNSSINTVLCAVQVPCGRAASGVLDKAQVKPHVVSYEQNVKATLAKVQTGDADAAIVYRTDVKSADGKVTGIVIPDAQNTTTRLPIVQLSDSAGAKDFVDAVLSAAGQKTLTDMGFGTP